jgi:hypothetical protein
MCTGCDLTEEMPAEPLGHDEVQHDAVAATCTEKGNEAYVTCSRCDYTTIKETEALGHKEVQCKGKDATCTEKGYEPYVFCERCEYRTFKEIPALGHDEIKHERKQSTCLEKGWTEYVTCSRCDYTTFKELPLSGHQQAVLAAKQPTCTETGLTVGSYCKVCNVTIKAQTVVAAKGHSCKQGICTVCGAEDYIDPDQYASRVCYDSLLKHSKGKQMQQLYDLVYEASRRFHLDYSVDPYFSNEKGNGLIPNCTISVSHLMLTCSDVEIVRNSFLNDNPIFYWFVHIPSTEIWEADRIVKAIRITVDRDYGLGADRKKYNEQIGEKVKYYAEKAKGATSKYEIALAYYEAIIETITYAHEATEGEGFEFKQQFDWTQNIIGAFCKDRTVCAGYGRSFGMMLNFSGIESRTAIGYTSPEVTHLWTLAKMDDGNWYWFDPTWDDDDDDDPIEYRYFCVNDIQKVNWRDAFAINITASLGSKNFLDSHDITESKLQTRQKNHYLPERSQTEFSHDGVLEIREQFTVDGFTFVRTGYDEVRLVKANAKNVLQIPDKVTYNGREYTVTSVGFIMSSGLFDCTRAITSGYSKNVVIPHTVEYISPRAVTNENSSVNIFYEGTRSGWSKLQPGTKYTARSKIYCFSETRPNASGNYWHYVDGVPTPW